MVAAFVTDFVGVVAFFAMVFFTAVTVVFFFGGIVLGPPLSLSLSLSYDRVRVGINSRRLAIGVFPRGASH